MDTELNTHMAALPEDDAKPGDGMRYLLEHAPFLVEMPARINFKMAVRRLLRDGRVGEAVLAALAYDARTLELHPEFGGEGEGGEPRAAPDTEPTLFTPAPSAIDPATATWRIEGAQAGGSG